jgi:hypothetical protein
MINGLADPPDTPEPPKYQRLHEPEAGMVRIVVRMTLAQYNELFRHVTKHRTTMSAFCRNATIEKLGRIP